MKRTISAVLICLLVFTMLPLSAFADEGEEEQPISDTELILPEEEEIYEGTGSLAYAFDDSFIRNYVDNEQLDEAGHVARIHDEEELDTYVFLNRDGKAYTIWTITCGALTKTAREWKKTLLW